MHIDWEMFDEVMEGLLNAVIGITIILLSPVLLPCWVVYRLIQERKGV